MVQFENILVYGNPSPMSSLQVPFDNRTAKLNVTEMFFRCQIHKT